MVVDQAALRLGPLLAEGGEGKVYEVLAPPAAAAQPGRDLVFKQLRQPVPLSGLVGLAQFPLLLNESDAGMGARTVSSSAWPSAAVAVAPASTQMAAGTLMPRAPEPFWIRHKDGKARLATLSYLACDPDRIAFAYGVQVPSAGDPGRVALVYALSRLLESWEADGAPLHAVHGDLSAKNVLWSLEPAPAVYVLDCDGAALTPTPLAPPGPLDQGVAKPRATTPNWDDPALSPGAAPEEPTDRYALGLAFLRVVGAANFPLQSRQRSLEKVNVDLELPRSWRHMPDAPELWQTCEAALSVQRAAERPPPSQWCVHLEALLDALGASDLAAKVRASQGDPRASLPAIGGLASAVRRAPSAPDVAVRPVLRRRSAPTWQVVKPLVAGAVEAGAPGAAFAGPGVGPPGVGPSGVRPPSPMELLRRASAAWGAAHRLAWRLARLRGRRWSGLRRLSGVLAFDLAAACLVLFLVGMIVSPWIGL